MTTEHGVKVYFQLEVVQRLDVQVISNTNISVSKDLLDRMYETVQGSELRDWCQSCGLLKPGSDFTDRAGRSKPISVKEARTFIVNYFRGREAAAIEFNEQDTTPIIVKHGEKNPEPWRNVKANYPNLWQDEGLMRAGREFARLIQSQLAAFTDKNGKLIGKADARNKASNAALQAGWAFVAGYLEGNPVRLQRHFDLADKRTSHGPLRPDLLANGRHASDPENYRGLGFRTDNKERGRFAELFFMQAEKGSGITKGLVDAAIQQYEAKQAALRAKELKDRV